jgi:hypothetical protein
MTDEGALYHSIGGTYMHGRPTDPRIAAYLWEALGDAETVLNVGAGTGSYEPPDRTVVAVEPSLVTRQQRPSGAAPCMRRPRRRCRSPTTPLTPLWPY